MTDLPIIFSGPMVRALLEGRKTMTRRLAWREKKPSLARRIAGAFGLTTVPSTWQAVKPGDRLYVRENWAPGHAEHKGIIIYQADGIRGAWMGDGDGGRFLNQTGFISGFADPELRGYWEGPPKKWRPCIHLPRKYSRLTLVVTATKIEPLAAISQEDCQAEGATPDRPFGEIFRALHGEDIFDRNPEVVALTFTVHKSNIDSMPVAA